jgi:two-component system LytT family response regulator
MLRVAVIDDERLARQGLRQMLAAHPRLQIVGEADSKETALTLILQEKPDGIFLDVHMPGGTGFDLLQALEAPPMVVMVTAHAEHAIQAFDIEAVDYLLKPVKPARFAQAVQRLQAACAPALASDPEPTFTPEDHICLRTPQRTITVPVRDLLVLQAEGDFTRIYLKNSLPLMICVPLGQYEKLLPSPLFARLDRSLILNLQAPLHLHRKSRDEASLIFGNTNQEVPLGRTAQQRLRDALKPGCNTAPVQL